YISSSISNYVGVEKFLKFIRRYGNIPSAHIGINVPGLHCFNIDNAYGMYGVVDHIIKTHGRRKIAFMSGTRGVFDADERLRAYMEALRDNGICPDERYIYYGSFLREQGSLAIEEFLDKRHIKIDGLVGANDQMALYAMKELQKRGYKIPKDISIGGFDDLASAKSHKPALTTVHQPAATLGYTAIQEFVSHLMENSPQVINTKLPAHLIIRQSCGCPEIIPETVIDDLESRLFYRASISERDEIDSVVNTMTRNILGSFEEKEIRNVLDESLRIFDIRCFSLSKYVDSECSMTFYDINGQHGGSFQSNHLLEKGIGSFTRPFCKFVLPLYYRNEDIGFFISDFGSRNFSVLEIIRNHLSGALKGAQLLDEVKKYAKGLEKIVEERTIELETALQNIKDASEKLERMAVIDELTGLYNRRGFMDAAKRQVELFMRNKIDILLVFLDIDGLKNINDNFGHASGDTAIKMIAEILLKSFRKTDIIARLGGDEFTILAIDCSIREYDNINKRMQNMIEEYNRTSGLFFRLSVSSGTAPSNTEFGFTLEQLMHEADSELYIEKKRKKSERRKG
ncbi:MAG: GGDEF domain-containing protein, partial [Candidatus Latescibacteria bacterium]|nr:GGDEF domain-containing protein [Candidatus Latescibacterota bacterium]